MMDLLRAELSKEAGLKMTLFFVLNLKACTSTRTLPPKEDNTTLPAGYQTIITYFNISISILK
jgi:hypothetical protein